MNSASVLARQGKSEIAHVARKEAEIITKPTTQKLHDVTGGFCGG
jgi:hypothetical protein